MGRMKEPAPRPCISCPYRRDVPSGIWTEDEYLKLPEYDKETFAQPAGVFLCHQQDGRVCAGWAGCHNQNPPGHELLSLRLAYMSTSADVLEKICEYQSPVPLWVSGHEAWLYGTLDVDDPSPEALLLMEKIERTRRRGTDAQDPDTSGDAS